MARISGVDIPRDKQVHISLTYIHGVGRTRALEVCEGTGVNPFSRVRDLTDEEVTRIRAFIDENLKVEGDLRRQISVNIKRLVDLATYRGSRHKKKLPVRGQRTRCNARTRKGKAIAIAGKKLTPLKK